MNLTGNREFTSQAEHSMVAQWMWHFGTCWHGRPNGEVVEYGYGDHGLPISLRSSVKGTIVSAATYNPLGKPYDVTFGNGLTTRSFRRRTQYRYWGLDYGTSRRPSLPGALSTAVRG